jgi:hypothetical protein
MKRVLKVLLALAIVIVVLGTAATCLPGCQAQSTVTPATETVMHKDVLVQPKQTQSQDFTVEIWSGGQRPPAAGIVQP